MKKVLGLIYAIICYSIGFVSLLYWIASTGNLLEDASIDGIPTMDTTSALLKNIGLVLLFGLQHSVMARKGFKSWLTQYIPVHLERSTYVLATGVVLTLLVYQWEPLGGQLWSIDSDTLVYKLIYGLYFFGWVVLFISTFLINHYDLFGLRQAYLNFIGKPYREVNFKVVSFYKYTRHPLYLGAIIGIWATPQMTITHLVYALLLTIYILIGIYYEETDLKATFGEAYFEYRAKTSKILPLKVFNRSTKIK